MYKKIFFSNLFLFIFLNISIGQENETANFHDFYNKSIHVANKEEALQFAFKALDIAQTLNNDSLQASALVAISWNYKHLGNLITALDYALRAVPYYKKFTDKTGFEILNIQIASIYASLKNFPLSNSYYKVVIHSSDNYAVKLIAYMNMGENYRHIQKYDSALYYYQLAEDISANESFFTYNSYLFANRGLAYAAIGEKAKADSLLASAIQLFTIEKDLRALTQTYFEMARIAYQSNSFHDASRLATQAFETADTNHFVLELKDISQLLSQINEEQQNFTDAYRYLKSYNQYREKVSGDSVLSKISEMRAEFEISQKEQEVIYFKKISRARTIVALVTGIAGLLVVLLALFLYKLTQRLRSANQLLGEYNEELNQKNHIIHQALLDKEVLIKEIHHRVKNNLQIISSIINLQSMRIKDKATQEIFEEMQRRILAISSIHQKLYQSDSVTSINMKDYLSEVVDSIHIAFNNPQLNVKYEIMIQQIVMDIDSAVSMGLMVNELATNAYKYAFKPAQNNQFLVKLENPEPEKYQLTVKDNGLGLPTDFSLTKANSLGLRMVSLLTRQLKGNIRFYNQDGAVFEVVF
ncbi:MAG TPA: hypothetical protein DCQ26_03710 [Marinilabiliales bacterium]|nr:MAG: hypothetical protein A2W96_14520 [Bacteroidetes bacterium GWD2_40_43]OFX91437.1 MAG: hypothetical protein A2W97_04335 [Bacteroidetes bacterium GWE2_40_63]OFY19506.1 MAG: hypothetical protein A2W88_02215 [Bacteroidetes bacterium GWF2_40_13]OFZ32229.1 MAG: hypothetical protein A2437_19665 [Bacteroidetes bacterium RIFOXYC2_FULL_40_12]HAM97693.1 hypothetical protein [Marinilabiliales bacterium]